MRVSSIQCFAMIRSATDGQSGKPTGLFPLASILLVFMGLGAEPLPAQPFRLQTAPPASPSLEARQSFQAKIDAQARALARDLRLKRVPRHEQQALAEFVVGNVLFWRPARWVTRSCQRWRCRSWEEKNRPPTILPF